MKKRIFFSLCALGVYGMGAFAQNLAIKTNLLDWGLAAPNLSLELVTGERHSFLLSGAGMPKFYKKDFSGWMVMPEFRFWLSGRPLIREYIGIAAFAGNYKDNAGLIKKNMAQDGTYGGLAFTGGYAFYLGKRWTLDLTAGVGLALVNSRTFSLGAEKPENFDPLKVRVLLVNLGVTIGYIIK